MWPFHCQGHPRFRRVDDRVSVTGQIRPEDMPAIARAGFRLLVCARPDGEQRGQPDFAALAAVAERLGLTARHIPVGGQPGPEQAARMRDLLAATGGPVLLWCRSGARAEALHRLARE